MKQENLDKYHLRESSRDDSRAPQTGILESQKKFETEWSKEDNLSAASGSKWSNRDQLKPEKKRLTGVVLDPEKLYDAGKK